ncbi:histidine phosphatase family protein [Dictyobacter kobayashii]|uniref:Alpha-ribazole phosphatase n=1 Tax=Dictyobacter kobayashii TaxID=2014872 RepID=A0A402AV14_9CHLR|nr:histidine phosphatase family protein [Dictyobacter kobayashii]GCE22952.1 alpha-ribazole phosphatase [Dictyobacter kobayashii]
MTTQKEATTRLLLVRHGQTAQSREDAFCGVTEVPLTETGRKQAQQVAERLRGQSIDALYCSPQIRARDTAEPIARALQLEIQLREALREMNFGIWENQPRAYLSEHYPRELSHWEQGSWMTQIPEGETQQAVITRVVPCVIELLHKHAGQTVLLVSHKSTLRLLVGHVINMALPASRCLRLDPASITELSIADDQAQLIYHNDTSHLL